ncbi:mitochondrial glutamate carrier 1-like isoform X1 [Clavelina lepadiformis]|uniref:mitochondrial glutamate carrier 1-like isoform X1 n=1 Tax=Clavelina lepadiformis TaxID=159417 RepID=UPI00404279BD
MAYKSLENELFIASCINGGIAGLTGVACTFPIDLAKTRLQNQPVVNGRKMYNGLYDCIKTVLRNEGLRGLYQGSLPNLALIIPEKTIKLVANDCFRNYLSDDGRKISVANQLIAGAGAGCCQVIITSPMEMMKIYGQDAGRISALSGGSVATVEPAYKIVWRKFGVFGFYKGVRATLLRDIPFSMIYFPLFFYLNNLGFDDLSTRAPFHVTLVSAIIAAGVAAMTVMPADVVKTRLQSIHHTTRNYNGILDCFRQMYKEEGLRTFMRGAQARAVAIAPLFGIAQTVYHLGVGEAFLGIPQLRPV